METLGKILYYGIFYAVLLMIICSYLGKRRGDTQMLGREAGRELRGIAILMVLIGHLSCLMGFVTFPLMPMLGAPAVDIFLFLSAFGLMSSYAAKGLKGFAGRRLAVILIPYVITTLLKFPLVPMETMNWKIVLTNMLPINTGFGEMLDSSMWYVQYILLCYLVFFLVFSIPKLSVKTKTCILLAVGGGIAVYNGVLYYREEMNYMSCLAESYSHHLSFPLGALFYLVYEKAKKVSYKVYLPIAAGAFIVFQFLLFPGSDDYIKYYANNICYLLFFIAVFAVLKHFGRRSGLLQRLGDLSYYIYLNELIVISLFYRLSSLPDGINGLSVILVSIAAAIPVRLLCEWIFKKIKVRTVPSC